MYDKPLLGDYVTLYGICIAVGVLICIFLLRYLGKKTKVDAKFMDFVEINGYLAIAFGFTFAWLFQNFYGFIKNGVWSWSGGMTFMGGLIGGVGTFIIIYCILRKKLTGRITDILPFVPCCITIAHGFGRIGCFFAGCCYGRVAEPDDLFYFLRMKFPGHLEAIYPTQLFEAVFLFVLCGVMTLLLLKKKFKYNFVVYIGAYGIWRYLIEFVRGDPRGEIFKGVDWITPSQFWSLLMIVLTIPLFFFIRELFKRRDKELEKINNNIEVEKITE